MAKPFSELEAKMSPEARENVNRRVAESLRQIAMHDSIIAAVRERVHLLFGDAAVLVLEPDEFEDRAFLIVETILSHAPAEQRLRQLETWWVDNRPDDGNLDIMLRHVSELRTT